MVCPAAQLLGRRGEVPAFGGLGLGLPGHRFPAVVELQAAEPAVVQLAAAHPLQQVQKTPAHGIDLVAMLKLGDAKGSTLGAPGVLAKMVAKAAGHARDILAFAALVNRHIREAFRERAVDPVQVSSTLSAIIHQKTL
jgi:hypothetical protein